MTQSLCSPQDQPSPPSLIPSGKSVANSHRCRVRSSVFSMLVHREVSPKTKFVPKKRRWDTDSSCGTNMKEPGHSLVSWVEEESLQHLSAKYCPLTPSPRSTIAAAFSSDGRTLASTHGDHTVKIVDSETGNCLKVLNGHRRTPWVVRFHPKNTEIVASGSLDKQVRIWNTTTSESIRSHEFNRPIASISFHAEGELLAVASGHKLYMWHYKSSPISVLKTRRSLRAIHFHPHGAPFLLTAEVNEIDSLDSPMSRATSIGNLRHPPPAIFFTSTESIQTSLGAEMVHGHGVASSVVPPSGSSDNGITTHSSTSRFSTTSLEAAVALLTRVHLHSGVSGRGRSRGQTLPPQSSGSGLAEGASSGNTQHRSDPQPMVNRVQSEYSTPIAVSAAAEVPCTVKLRMWPYDITSPNAQLKSEKCLFTIPHAVLCSEMGAHISPCGRYLAACVACVLPNAEIDPGMAQQDSGLSRSPTQHPLTENQVIYELRVYSIQKESFGSVLVSRAIRAAHCLTSIQFSPTSENILLAYGRRHGSLLNSIVSNGQVTSQYYTVLEIYRVSDMELVRVLPSAEDEVNVACFHPSPGRGLVYGTQDGKLRIFRYNTAATSNFTRPNSCPEENEY